MLDERLAAVRRGDRHVLLAFGLSVVTLKVLLIIGLWRWWVRSDAGDVGHGADEVPAEVSAEVSAELIRIEGPSMVPSLYPRCLVASCPDCGFRTLVASRQNPAKCIRCDRRGVQYADQDADLVPVRWLRNPMSKIASQGQIASQGRMIARGDVVVVRLPVDGIRWGDVRVDPKTPEQRLVVKRVLALPGDTVDLNTDGWLLVNGEVPPAYVDARVIQSARSSLDLSAANETGSNTDAIPQPPIYDDWHFNTDVVRRMNLVPAADRFHRNGQLRRRIRYRLSPGDPVEPYPLRLDQCYFVVGDNVPVSVDSRDYGPVAVDRMVGLCDAAIRRDDEPRRSN